MANKDTNQEHVVITGAGPAGLTAAYELTKFHRRATVLEKGHTVGGLARTENFKGFHFDIGGHRFFTKVDEVKKMWHEVLGEDFLRRPRLSRIYYNNRFFYYPLKPVNALLGLGILESIRVILSYIRWQLFPYPQENTFEEWVTNRFGKRLFEIFFKTYTEKVWGIPTCELKAEWAAQRIKDLSLKTALLSIFMKPKNTIKTLIEEFHYPRYGPGMMWNAVKEIVELRDCEVRLNTDVVRTNRTGNRISNVTVVCDGHEEVVEGTHFISSMPISEFILKLDPPPAERVLHAAKKLGYRDFLTVAVIVNKRELFPDNWIYVHSSDVRVGRVQNFKNWSPDMVADQEKTSLGLEYFCFEGDDLWNTADAHLVELAKRELERIGLAKATDVEDGIVIRQPKAYPVYDSDYAEYLAVLKDYVRGLENFQSIGRNGLHRYNNQDHAMLTGMLAVRNIVLEQSNDLWSVNTEQEYHEEIKTEAAEADRAPVRVMEAWVAQAFPRLDRFAFGLATGTTLGILLFVMTMILVLKGGPVVGPRLALLSQYFPGYTVSGWGSLIGLGYGFLGGYAAGWTFALVRNTSLFLYLAMVHERAERDLLRRFLEFL
jgi:protoporphyrinogen oxidase